MTRPRFLYAPSIVVMECDLSLPPPRPRAKSTSLRVHTATGPDDPVVAVAFSEARRRFARHAWARGDHANFILDGDTVLGSGWIATKSHRDPVTGLRAHLRPGEAFAYDHVVDAGLRAASPLRAAVIAHDLFLIEITRGHTDPAARWIYTLVDATNTPSARLLAGVGLKEVQRARILQLFELRGITLPFSARPTGGVLSRRRSPPRM